MRLIGIRNTTRLLCLIGLIATMAPGLAAATPLGGVRLTEVLFAPAGPDATREWVEIYNASDQDIVLSDYSLGWGRDSYTEGTYILASSLAPGTTLAPGASFVIGGPTSNGSNGSPTYDEVFNFAPDFYNGDDGGGTIEADAVALFFGDIGTNPLLTPVHALIYGPTGATTTLLDEQGQPASVLLNTDGFGQGASAEWLGGDNWARQSSENPGPPAVPEPGTALLVIFGLASLTRASRQR